MNARGKAARATNSSSVVDSDCRMHAHRLRFQAGRQHRSLSGARRATPTSILVTRTIVSDGQYLMARILRASLGSPTRTRSLRAAGVQVFHRTADPLECDRYRHDRAGLGVSASAAGGAVSGNCTPNYSRKHQLSAFECRMRTG